MYFIITNWNENISNNDKKKPENKNSTFSLKLEKKRT